MEQTEAEILKKYEGLAVKVAMKHRWSGIPMTDLIQAARLGILTGARSFDEGRAGASLTSCLFHAARREVSDLCRSSAYAVSTRSRAVDRISAAVGRLIRVAEAQGLTLAEARSCAAVELGVPIQRVDAVVQLMQAASPDDLEFEHAPDADIDLDGVARSRLINLALDGLKPRDRQIMEAHFFEGRSPRDISQDHGVSQRRIEQIIAESLPRMRDFMSGFSFDDLV